MEAEIFKNENFTVAQGFALAFSAGADAIERKRHGIAEKLFQFFCGRPHGIFQIRAAFGAAEMRSKYEAGSLFNCAANFRTFFVRAGFLLNPPPFLRAISVRASL